MGVQAGQDGNENDFIGFTGEWATDHWILSVSHKDTGAGPDYHGFIDFGVGEEARLKAKGFVLLGAGCAPAQWAVESMAYLQAHTDTLQMDRWQDLGLLRRNRIREFFVRRAVAVDLMA